MAYIPQNLLMDYQRMRAESLLGRKALAPLPYQLSQPVQKDYNLEAYHDINSVVSAMNALNGQMSLQQMAALRLPEQVFVSQLVSQNTSLRLQVKSLTAETKQLAKQLEMAEDKLKMLQTQAEADAMASELGKKKRHRRTANEISREFKCPKTKCLKSYGSEGSLNQHIKLKHPEIEIPKSETSQFKQVTANPSAENQLEETSSKTCSKFCKLESML